MAELTGSRNGLFHGYDTGEQGWGDGYNSNMQRMDLFLAQLSVRDRHLTAPPGSPAAGDAYIVAATATGAWAGHENHVAVWDQGAWVFGTPRLGWLVYIEDEQVISVFKTAWSAGVAI